MTWIASKEMLEIIGEYDKFISASYGEWLLAWLADPDKEEEIK